MSVTPPQEWFWTPHRLARFPLPPLRRCFILFPVKEGRLTRPDTLFDGLQTFSGGCVVRYVVLPPYTFCNLPCHGPNLGAKSSTIRFLLRKSHDQQKSKELHWGASANLRRVQSSVCAPLCCKNLCCASRFYTGGRGAGAADPRVCSKGVMKQVPVHTPRLLDEAWEPGISST